MHIYEYEQIQSNASKYHGVKIALEKLSVTFNVARENKWLMRGALFGEVNSYENVSIML